MGEVIGKFSVPRAPSGTLVYKDGKGGAFG